MKGGLAAAAAAALRFIAKRPLMGSISFLVTGDEEGQAVNGTVKLLEWALMKGERFDHCIVGEPTSVSPLGDTIKHGRRGSLTGRLLIYGRQGHVAYPHLAENPIWPLAALLTALASPPLDHGNADFEPSNLEVTSVDVGNPAANVIPGEARLAFNVRFNDLWMPESLKAEIARRIAAAGGGARATLDLRADQRTRLCDQTRAVHRSYRRRGRGRDGEGRRRRRAAALPTRASSGTPARLSSSASSTPPSMRSTSGSALDDLEALSLIYERALERYFAEFGA